jgi:hypothetical protein
MSAELISVPAQELDVLFLAVDRMELLGGASRSAAAGAVDPILLLEALSEVYAASRSLVQQCSRRQLH